MHHTQRKSFMSIGRIYFWTATIHKWQHLLQEDNKKKIILDSLKSLSTHGDVQVFGYVIMPNHVHFIWRINKMNGKESPKSSFLKYTSHLLLKKLKIEGKAWMYQTKAKNKSHEVWQRDSLAVELYSRKVALQKLAYIHDNPVRGKWSLATDVIHYPYSSAQYYETGIDDHEFMCNLYTEFDG